MDSDTYIKNIVSLVISDIFNFKTKTNKIITASERKQTNNEKREFEGIITDMITNEFIKSQDQTAQFIQTIYNTFNLAINSYIEYNGLPARSIFFIYKGGNILRIIAKDFTHELPGTAGDILQKYYGEYFKKSDADFSIFIDPSLDNYDKIFEDITKLSYLLLNYLRIIFMTNLTKYFNYYENSSDTKINLLKEILNKLNKSSSLTDKSNRYFNNKFVGIVFDNIYVMDNNKVEFVPTSSSRRADSLVDYAYPSKEELILYKLIPIHKAEQSSLILTETGKKQQILFNDRDSVEYYISVNKTLRFNLQNLFMAFNLVRMKVNFTGLLRDVEGKLYSEKLGGELIDVSIIHKDTSEIHNFFKNRDNYVRIFTYINGNTELSFRATSFEYLIHDLELILFKTVENPWVDNKYAKRIKRLMFLYFFNMLVTSVLSEIRPFILSLKTLTIDPILIIQPHTYNTTINKVIKDLDIFIKYSDEKHYNIKTLLVKYKNILQNSKNSIKYLIEFVKLLENDTNIMLKTLHEIQEYINTNGKLNLDKIYKFSQFGGIL